MLIKSELKRLLNIERLANEVVLAYYMGELDQVEECMEQLDTLLHSSFDKSYNEKDTQCV